MTARRVQLELDERLLACCDEVRRRELEAVVDELNRCGGFGVHAALEAAGLERFRLVLRSPRGATLERWVAPLLEPVAERHLSWSALKDHIRNYQAVIERIVDGGYAQNPSRGDSRFEALDHGKRVVHTEAGETLVELLDGFADVDEETARNLFTLLFLIRTELPAHVVRYHRAHFTV